MTVTVTHAFTNPVADDPTFTGVKPSHWNAAHTVTGLGTAAEADTGDFATAAQGALADSALQPGDIGTTANKLVQLDGTGKLPAVDGSQLTNLPAGSGAVDSVNGLTGTVVLDPDDLDDSATTNKFTTASDISKLAAIEASADVTDAGNVGSSIHGATAKATPVDADTVPLIDSAASNVLKKVTWANVKATLKTYFDTLYLTASSTATLTNKTFDAAGTGNALSNVALSMFAANVADTDGTLAANSDSRVATQKAVKTYVDANAGGGGFWIGGAVVRTASGSQSTGGSGNYNYNNDPTTAPTASQAHRKDDATLSYTATASGTANLRFNYAGSGQYTFTQINGSQHVHLVAALFKDSDANAVAWAVCAHNTITATTTGNQNGRFGFNVTFLVDASDTSAHTYHMRFMSTTAATGQGTCGAINARVFTVEEMS